MPTRTFTVEQLGVGKPDYSREVSSSIQRAGIYLHYNQGLLVFGRTFSAIPSLMTWVRGVLTPGEMDHLINVADGQEMPYVLPAGYTFTAIEIEYGGSEDSQLDTYYDMQLAIIEGVEGGSHHYYQRIIGFSTATLDPTGAAAHLIDVQITNKGAGDFTGGVTLLVLIEKVGSEPLPTTKTVVCKYCGNLTTVPLDTSKVVCSKCGALTIYQTLSRLRGA